MKLSLWASTVALVALSSCGSAETPAQALESGRSAIQSGDHDSALSALNSVVANAEATSEQKFEARCDLIACEGNVNGDEAAETAFNTLKDEHKDQLDVGQLTKLGEDAAAAGCTNTALSIITVATALAGEDATAKASLQQLADLILSSGGDDAREALAALGYVN